jgi:hypothetical protein
MSCNSHVHSSNGMMTQSPEVRSGTHIAVNRPNKMEKCHPLCEEVLREE